MNSTEKKTIGDYILLFLKGRMIYVFAILPFRDVDTFKEDRKTELRVDTGAKHKELHYLKNNWTYYLGGAISSLLIFAVPFTYLNDNFHFAITIGIGVFTIPLLGITIIKFFSEKKDKKELINSLILFVVFFSLCLALRFVKEPTFGETEKSGKYILLGFFTIGFFFFSYLGLGTTTLFYLSSTLIPLGNIRREGVYTGLKGRLVYSIFLLIARGVGSTTGYLAKARTEAKPEQLARKAAILLAGFIFSFGFQLKGDAFASDISKTAQIITRICVPLTRFFISIILVIPQAKELIQRKKSTI